MRRRQRAQHTPPAPGQPYPGAGDRGSNRHGDIPRHCRSITGRDHRLAERRVNKMSELAGTVCAEIDAAREELVELCGALVAAPSVNPPGRTAEVADLV